MRLFAGLFVLACAAGILLAGPSPLTTKEISLMLRSGYSNQSVMRELSSRGFADVFDADAEQQLARAGANADTIEALKSGRYRVAAPPPSAMKQADAPATSVQSLRNTSNPAPAAPTQAPTVVLPPDLVYSRLKGNLIQLNRGVIGPFDDSGLENKKFYLFFFSASWNADARRFTPQLVDFYNRVEPEHPELEIVFFSSDRSQFAMENYMHQNNMPWPALAWDSRSGAAGDISSGLVKELPCLVLVNASGVILSYSHTGNQTVTAQQVMAETSRRIGDQTVANSR